MASGITYEGALSRSGLNDRADDAIENENDNTKRENGGLFAGQKLWLSFQVPLRQWLIENAQNNGATITLVDNQADVIIYDPLKKNAPPGAVSYSYIETSIREGKLENLDKHRIASVSRVNRPVGSVTTASKGSRNSFTNDEDQLLWNWIRPYMESGGKWKGNEIYKHLETINPRHTYQSWRDRWIKHTQFQHRKITQHVSLPEPKSSPAKAANGPSPKRRKIESSSQLSHSQRRVSRDKPSSQTARALEQSTGRMSPAEAQVKAIEQATDQATNEMDGFEAPSSLSKAPFESMDQLYLWNATPKILLLTPSELDVCWQRTAIEYKQHSLDEWRLHFYQFTLPQYRSRHGLESEAKFRAHIRKLQAEQQGQADIELHDDSHDQREDKLSLGNRRDSSNENGGGDVSEDTDLALQKTIERTPAPNESRKRKHDNNSQSESTQHNPTIESSNQSSYQSNDQAKLQGQSVTQPISDHKISQNSQAFSVASLPDIPYNADPFSPADKHTKSSNPQAQGKRTLELLTGEVEDAVITDRRATQRPRASDQVTNDAQGFNLQQRQHASIVRSKKRPQFEEDHPHGKSWIPPQKMTDSPMFFSNDSNDNSDDQDVFEADADRDVGAETSELDHESNGLSVDQLLSQNFETAQQQIFAESRLGLRESISRTRHSENDQIQPGQMNRRLVHPSQELRFETAPETSTGSFQDIHSSPGNVKSGNTTLMPLSEINEAFAIPPPEGGWSDDEDDMQVLGEFQKDAVSIKQEHDSNDMTDRLSTLEPIDDIDAWLSSQKARHGDIDELVIDEICIKALEATTLQLSLATAVVNTLASTYAKGKHPALKHIHQFLNVQGHLQTPSKRETKSMHTALSNMVDELMPSDRRGVWTQDDDLKLTSTNARHVEEVERKHGENGVRTRFEYMAQLTTD